KDIDIEDSITNAIDALAKDILYSTTANKENVVNDIVNKFIPNEKLYFLENSTEVEKKNYFKSKIKDRLYKNENSQETRLYKELKDML
ncbi:MAG: hypothetical protein AB7D49_06510, partial [Arcobacter sp.]